jgi:hypothetical protein
MKKVILIVAIIAGAYAFYEQSKPDTNVWIVALCFVLFMLGLFYLNKKTPSNFDQNDDENDNKR